MIQENLFDLTSEQVSLSKMMYNDKVIKCLVAPYHTYSQLKKVIKYTNTTYLFPERDLNISQLRSLMTMLVASPYQEEIRIITTNQNVIMDMIDDCVRVLTEGDEVVPSPCKTFMANIHSIRHYLLENEDHQISKSDKNNNGTDEINNIISIINKSTTMSKSSYKNLISRIQLIGENIIRLRLLDMAQEINVK